MSDETPAPRPLEPIPAEPTPAGPTSGGPSSGGPPPLPPPERRWDLLTQAALLVMVVTLLSFGRTWWCKCGGLSPWTGDALSQHTSQHLLDPYSLTHVLHGVGFYALLWLTLGGRAGPRLRWALALCVEAGWEVLENTNWVIERYRAGTISLDYYGDSVLNSLSDVLCCALGYLLARTLPWKASLAFVLAVELLLLVWIRDNLTLNVVMLLMPLPGVQAWQAGG